MHVDVLIIGQGLCGSFLSWELHKEGKSFLVIDNNAENSSSKVAAGIINPVTGRRYVTTWMIDELMDYAHMAYASFGKFLETPLISSKTIIDFFPSPQMRNAFVERVTENDTYLHAYPNQNDFNSLFNYDFGCGEISPAYIVNVQLLLIGWKKKLTELNALQQEQFVPDELKVERDKVNYKGITAQQVVFCDGVEATNNPWFSLLPFSPNKGEVLILECEIPGTHIYKKGMTLAPLAEQNLFWLGSSYQWEFENNEPTETFYKGATTLLDNWLKLPYKVLSHKAAVRPATLERRPFVGFHPQHQNIGILNGMGTKGTSLAPFFAHQLAQKIVYDLPIAPEADVHRFNRILSKS